MKKLTFSLPQDLALWLNGYAAARAVTPSRALSDILIEKRASRAKESQELSAAQEAFDKILQSKSFLELSKQISVSKNKSMNIDPKS